MMVAGLILAGGQGRRMGGVDKALLPLKGRPLVRHAIDRLSPQVERLAISGQPSHAGFGLPVLPDAQAERLGPLAGVAAGLVWAAALGADHLVTAAVDTPFLPCDLVPRLLMAAEDHGGLALAVTPERDHPTFALWPVDRSSFVQNLLDAGERRMRVALDGAGRASFPDEGAFFNINTPADLARAETMLAAES